MSSHGEGCPADISPLLTCGVCGDALLYPVAFPCHHRICYKCFNDKLASEHSEVVNCVYCGKGSSVSKSCVTIDSALGSVALSAIYGGSTLQSTPPLAVCSLCSKKRSPTVVCRSSSSCGMMCEKHAQTHAKFHRNHVVEKVSQAPTAAPPCPLNSRDCSTHSQPCTMFCPECNRLTCTICAIDHQDHGCLPLQQSKPTMSESMNLTKTVLERKKYELREYIEQIQSVKSETEKEEKERINEINSAIELLHTYLETKRAEMVSQVESEQRNKVASLDKQRSMIDLHIYTADHGISSILQAEQDSDPLEFAYHSTIAADAASVINSGPNSSTFCLAASAPLEDHPLNVEPVCRAIQDVKLIHMINASLSTMQKVGSGPVIGNLTTSFHISTRDRFGQFTTASSPSTICPSLKGPASADLLLREEAQGHYVLDFVPHTEGDYEISLKCDGADISGSPLTVTVVPGFFFGSQILTGVAMDAQLHKWICEVGRVTPPRWKLLLRGTIHGFTASTFHNMCDTHSPTLLVIKTTDNYVFGGFTILPWSSTGRYTGGCCGRNFLFSLLRNNTPSGVIMKCTDHAYCILGKSQHSAAFGWGNDLMLCDNCNTTPGSCTNVPSGYEAPPSTPWGSFLAGTHNQWLVSELEVWEPDAS
ncbi:hypothetical protein Pelo_13914 [Pelomyxa schiedti]|nr:hypothetical protein Pelo_13914 [Pelomyxa schiedti]